MSLDSGTPPAGALAVINSGLARLLGHAPMQTTYAQRTIKSPLTAAAPLAVYYLGAGDLAQSGLAQARFIGWRYLVYAGTRAHAAAQLPMRTPRDQPTTVAFNIGPFVGGTVAAVKAAESLARHGKQRFRVVLLQIPALDFMAVWLRPQRAKDGELTLPIEPSPIGHAGQPLSPAALAATLAPAIARRAAFDNRPR